MAAVAARPLSNGALSELRKTCDECQSIKVRCDPMPSTSTSSSSASSSSSSVADAQAPPTCQRCHRLGLQCVYSPKIKVIKRKRRKASEAEPPHNSPPQTIMPIAQQQQQQQTYAPTLAVPSGASPPVPHMLIDDSLAPPPPPQYGQRQGGQQQQQQRAMQGNSNGTGAGNEDWTDFFRWPEPPATPDFGAAPWEDWFRSLGPTSTTNTPAMDQGLLGGPPTANAFALGGPSLNLGGLDPSSFTGCLPALHPAQRPTDAQMSAMPSPPPAAPSLPTPGPSRIDPNVTSNDEEARHRRGGSTPQVSHPPVPPLTRTLTTPATSAAPSQAKSTPAPTPAPAPAASTSCSSYTSTSLADFRPSNLEIKLSAISASLSTALDDCDIDRLIGLGGVTSRQARKRRSEAERKLLSLLVEADDVWREIDRLSRARMKEVEALMAADPAAKEDGGDAAEGSSNSKGCGHKHARVGGGSSIKERMYARGLGSLVEPIRVTTSMLALSLSYQVCDALRLISRLLDAAGEYRGDYHDEEDHGADDEDDEGEDSKDARSPSAFSPPDDAGSTTTNTTRDDPAAVEAARRLANVVSPVRIAGRPLPSSLHRPLVASLWTHHGESLLGSLVSSISLAQDWHHLGEGQGEGPHSFCAMQTQGARVVASLEALIQTRGGGSGAAACCGKLKRKRGETVTSTTGAGTAAATNTAKEGGASGEAVRAE